MTDTYRFIDPVDHTTYFETYSTDYVANQITVINNSITTNTQNVLNQLNQEISTVNNAMSTLNTSITNDMNTLNTNLTQYVNTQVQNITNDITNLTTVVNEITDGSGNVNVTNVVTENLTTVNQTFTDGTLTFNNSNIVFDYNNPGNITNVKNITFNPGQAGILDMSGGTIVNISNPINPSDAANKQYVDQAVASVDVSSQLLNYLKLDGTKAMTGTLSLGGNNINNVNAVTASAVNTSSISGGAYGLTVTGTTSFADVIKTDTLNSNLSTSITLNSVRIASMADPVADQDAATKAYVDNQVLTGGGAFFPIDGTTPMEGNLTIPTPYQLNVDIINSTTSLTVQAPDGIALSGTEPIISGLKMQTTPASYDAVNVEYVAQEIATVENNINTTVKNLFPADATTTNTLVTQSTLDDAIQNTVSRQISADATGAPFATRAALNAGPWYYQGATTTVTMHDFAIIVADESAPAPFTNGQTRHAWDGLQWSYSFGLNEEPFTSAQNAAINSGVTAATVAQVTSNSQAIINLISVLNPSAVAQQISDMKVIVDASNASAASAEQSAATALSTAQAALPLAGGTMTGAIKATSVTRVDGTTNFNLNYPLINTGTLSTNLAAGGYKITGLASPTDNADAATKAYVDPRSFTSVTVTSTDPGAGSALATGAIVLVYTP